MTTKLQTLIEAIQQLSPLEQLNLISVISQSLYQNCRLNQLAADFWEPQGLEQLIKAQRTRPISDIADLKADFWPEDESADDLIECIYSQRLEDSLRDS